MKQSALNTFQQASHKALVESNCDDRARQEFIKSLKGYIQGSLLPAVSGAYFQRALPSYAESEGKAPENYKEARTAFQADPLFKAYLAINRSSQELQWFSVIDALEDQAEQLEEAVESISQQEGHYR